MIYAMWIGVLGVLTLFFSSLLDKQFNPNQSVNSYTRIDGVREAQIQRNRYGHYVTNGSINGHEVVFFIDTGASDVSIPQVIAKRLKLKHGLPVTFQTANGMAQGYMTNLNHVALGDIELTDVSASINPNAQFDEILLGMSFLKHLEFIQRGNILTLRQYP